MNRATSARPPTAFYVRVEPCITIDWNTMIGGKGERESERERELRFPVGDT